MEIFNDRRTVPFSSEQMFDLISAVERYPEFLPGWRHARISEHEGNRARVDQGMAWNGVHIRFGSQVVYTRPERIDITATEDPFRQLTVRWLFRPADPMGCTIDLHIGFEFRSTVLRHIVQPMVRSRLQGIVSAFEERAHLVYPGTHELSEGGNHPKASGIR